MALNQSPQSTTGTLMKNKQAHTDCHNICSGVSTVTDDKSVAQVCRYFCIRENTDRMVKLTGLLVLFHLQRITKAGIRNENLQGSVRHEHKAALSPQKTRIY